jgi:hypothetical protein
MKKAGRLFFLHNIYSGRTKYSARPNRRQFQSKKLNFQKTFFTKDKKW